MPTFSVNLNKQIYCFYLFLNLFLDWRLYSTNAKEIGTVYPVFAKIQNRTITKIILKYYKSKSNSKSNSNSKSKSNSKPNSNSNSKSNSKEYIKKGVDVVPKKINGIIDINIKNYLTENNGKIKEEIGKMDAYCDKIKDNSEKLLDSNLAPEQNSEILTNLNNLNTDMWTIIKNSITRMEDLEKYIKNIESKLLEDTSISEIISNYKIYLETLSIHELCILINILISIFIITCLISILFAFYGNYLIEKFSLHKK